MTSSSVGLGFLVLSGHAALLLTQHKKEICSKEGILDGCNREVRGSAGPRKALHF